MIKDEFGNRRFFGVYRGVVKDTNDPDGLGRVRAVIPQVLLTELSGWMWVAKEVSLTTKSVKIGQGIWVQFEGGDPSFPVGVGFFGNEVNLDVIDCGVIA
jgi:hypothetical protein